MKMKFQFQAKIMNLIISKFVYETNFFKISSK